MAVTLTVQITPNASRSEVVGWVGGKLKIKIKAPAVEGKANAELLRFVAEKLGVRPNRVGILRGDTSRTKVLSLDAEAGALEAAFTGAGARESRRSCPVEVPSPAPKFARGVASRGRGR